MKNVIVFFAFLFCIAANAATWYVSPTGTDGENSEGTAENPFATLANAIAKASAEDEIVLMKGTHSVKSTCTITERLTIRGETGNRDDVILTTVVGNINKVFINKGDGTIIRDLTFNKPGGNAPAPGAAVLVDNTCSIINCRITGLTHNGGGDGGIISGYNYKKITVKDCLFDHNAFRAGDNCIGLYGSGGSGKAMAMIHTQCHGSHIENCTIVSNAYVGWYDLRGVIGINVGNYSNTVKNCEIAYNTAHFLDPFTSEGAWVFRADNAETVCENLNIHDNFYWGVLQDSSKIKAVSIAKPSETVFESNNGPLYPQSTPEVQTRSVTDVAGLYKALEDAEPWSEIVLAPGEYVLISDVDVKKPVVIRGATGNRDDIIIKGNVNKYCIRLWTDGAAIKDLTVSESIAAPWFLVKAPIAIFGGGLVSNCHITGNSGSAGIFGVRNYNGTVIDTLIDGNSGRDWYASEGQSGNGFYWSKGELALMDRCIVADNTVTDIYQGNGSQYVYSSGIFIVGGTVRNTQVSRNIMAYKPDSVTDSTSILSNYKALGVYLNGANAVIENCTVSDNISKGVAQENVGGIVCVAGTIKNTLLWNNGDENGAKIVNMTGSASNYKYCASDNVTDVEGGVKLTAAPYEYKNSIAKPIASSPIVNSGLKDLSWMAQAVDLIGNKRISSGRVDIGAVESQTAGFSITVR